MRLPFVPVDGLCRKCGRDAPGLTGDFICEDCRLHRPAFDRAASVFRFEGDARELINGFKFREHLHLRNDLVDFLEALAHARFHLEEVACLVPMPSTIGHRWLRGYNQCEILAKALAVRLRKPCRPLIKRVGLPARQGGLDEAARRENVIGTFAPNVRILRPDPYARLPHMRTVLLIDDIMTTGSTLSEAAKTLKAAGIGRVWTLTLARSVRI